MAVDLVLRGAQLPDRHGPVDIVIQDGLIAALGRGEARAARETIDLAGRVVTPGLVEAHIHLDKALLDDRVTATTGTLDEAIRVTADAERHFTVDDAPVWSSAGGMLREGRSACYSATGAQGV